MTKKTSVIEDPIEACEAALASVTPGGALVICGSFFLAAECRGWLAAKSS
jgi:dihydrofolate synthase/folylpolyglutamate synthase